MRRSINLISSFLLTLTAFADAFAPGIQIREQRKWIVVDKKNQLNVAVANHPNIRHFPRYANGRNNEEDLFDTASSFISPSLSTASQDCWSPPLRIVMATLAFAGVIETSYLTYVDLRGVLPALCSTTTSSCSSVLSGPYSHILGTDIPLASLGLCAYVSTFSLVVQPLLQRDSQDDTKNRLWLTAAATTMGVFSVFLMSILIFVLHMSCPYCIASAIFSIGLAAVAWFGEAIPTNNASARSDGLKLSTGGGLLACFAAVILFASADAVTSSLSDDKLLASSSNTQNSATLVTSKQPPAPPVVTTTSSNAALALANDLVSLDTSFYGAFWCSHCYEQKQILGAEAMKKIPYIECSKDGANANAALCRSKKIPGYPTWEIAGKLYPGEQALEELQQIVAVVKRDYKSSVLP